MIRAQVVWQKSAMNICWLSQNWESGDSDRQKMEDERKNMGITLTHPEDGVKIISFGVNHQLGTISLFGCLSPHIQHVLIK